MFKLNNWKEKIYLDDLKSIIINGLLAAILGGVLAGLVDFLFVRILSVGISFGLLILFYFITGRMKKSYYNYHILYPVLSLVFMVIGLIFSEFSYYFCYFQSLHTFKLLISGSFYLDVLLSPVYNLIVFFKTFDILALVYGIINLLVYIYAFVICYRTVKGRN